MDTFNFWPIPLPDSRGARVSFWLWILKVNSPTRNLHILNPEVVLITVWGATFGNQWEYHELPLTSCVIFRKIETSHSDSKQHRISKAAHNIPTDSEKRRPEQSSGPPQHSKYRFLVGPLTLQLSPLIMHFFKFGSSTKTNKFILSYDI